MTKLTKEVAYDTETYPIFQTGKSTNDPVPRLVCLSYADDEHPDGVLLDRYDAVGWWLEQLYAKNTLVGANLAFDLNVMLRACQEEEPHEYPSAFEMVFDAKKRDVQVQARLEDIARGGMFIRGGYSLDQLEKRYLPDDVRTTEKKGFNVWRLRYNELEGVDVKDYPADAARYALEDAVNTWAVHKALRGSKNEQGTRIRTHYDWLLSLMSAWGLLVDQEWVGMLAEHYEAVRDEARAAMLERGLVRGPDNERVKSGKSTLGSKDMAAIREMFAEAFMSVGLTPPRTKSGKYVSTDRNAMNELEDRGALTPAFTSYRDFNRADKFISTYLQPLADAGDLPLCPRFNALVDSGRTSSSGPSVQNFPARLKDAERQMLYELLEDPEEFDDETRMMRGFITGPDIRGAFVPRPGCVFVAADYSAIEMACVAQATRNLTGELGTLAEAINNGIDLHNYVGAQMMGISYEEFTGRKDDGDPEVKKNRDGAKIGNYGGWGGATPPTLRTFARQQDIHLTEYQCEDILRTMATVWTEREPYFRAINSFQQPSGNYHVQQHGPDRITSGWRLRVTKKFTQAANTLFQGMAADGALWSLNLLARDVYFNEDSPLFGARIVLFVHDEFVIEVAADKAEAAGARLSELMVKGMKRFTPDLVVEAQPEILEDRWAK